MYVRYEFTLCDFVCMCKLLSDFESFSKYVTEYELHYDGHVVNMFDNW